MATTKPAAAINLIILLSLVYYPVGNLFPSAKEAIYQ